MELPEPELVAQQGNTPLCYQFSFPDLDQVNARLCKLLVNWSADKPDQVSNMPSGNSFFDNKWLSDKKLHHEQDEDVQLILKLIEPCANSKTIASSNENSLSVGSMWCMVSRAGFAGKPHNHAGLLSVAYYVDAGESSEDVGGMFQLHPHPKDPSSTIQVLPRSGAMLLFPSQLFHSVTHYRGVKPRIVISANLRI
ncbi:MAG: 2OG-Fe(II) oxygenase family protein [Pseudomonadales bacterium]|nr:2OG-Fe(II) oxygenase family protein [Pseudomonadales bacterium]